MKGIITYLDSVSEGGKTYVHVYGRLSNGKSFLCVKEFSPYFYIRESDLGVARRAKLEEGFEVEKTEKRNKNLEGVAKLVFKTKRGFSSAYKVLHKVIDVYEADLSPQQRFMIDNDLYLGIEIEGECEIGERVDCVFVEPKLKPADSEGAKQVKLLSIDTESDKGNNKLFCIGLYSQDFKRIFMVTNHKIKDVVACKDERECLVKFREELLRFDPDIITGWSVVDFDFVLLKQLFEKHKLDFDLGRNNKNCRIRIESDFFRDSSIDVPGRQVLDALALIRDPILRDAPLLRSAKFDSFSLQDVSSSLLNETKTIKGKSRHKEIEKLYYANTSSSHAKLARYNLQDCRLVYEILRKTKLIELAFERARLTGLTLDRLRGSIVAFDSLYIREATKRGFVSPTTSYKQKERRITGGFVLSPKEGIYKSVAVLDFKSLYPSIIRTFNIDPLSYVDRPNKKEKQLIIAPNGAAFKNSEGVLPEIIAKLAAAREKAKKEKDFLKSHAIKIIMNSFFGVLASPSCRYFNLNIANAITSFGRFIIKLTAQKIEEKGYKVIYSDTDSVFVEFKTDERKALAKAEELQRYINDFYKSFVRERYSRESYLFLEFEKLYLVLMIPPTRGREQAAKKRYAGIVRRQGKEVLEVVGLEAIRGDWTDAAKEFQRELLLRIFRGEKVERFIREYVSKIKQGKMDDKLVYRKALRKALDEYTKTTPPHVKAARQLDKLETNVIEYFQTIAGPEPVQKLRHKIDYEHYINKQIKVIAEQILSLIGKDFDSIVRNSTQKKLF
ncbi:DNA polymerase II [Candidatus Pacearchaeota archaeon]|nr:MAG: DNA polymerase II [Candidatus Pacearchaeota archaeon]